MILLLLVIIDHRPSSIINIIRGKKKETHLGDFWCRGIRIWSQTFEIPMGIVICHEESFNRWNRAGSQDGQKTIGVASRSRGGWMLNVEPRLLDTFIYCSMLLVPLPLRIAGRHWEWLLWYHPQSTTENGWFGMCYWWHLRVSRLTVVSHRHLRAWNSTLRGWASKIESRL